MVDRARDAYLAEMLAERERDKTLGAYFRVARGDRGHAVPEPLIRYRAHDDSLGARHHSGFAEMLNTLHRDRSRFFGSARCRRQLGQRLKLCIRVDNAEVSRGPRRDFPHRPKHP